MQRCGELAEKTEADAVELGAYKLLADLAMSKLELMGAVGRLPKDWEAIEELAKLNRLTRRILDAVVENDQVPVTVVQIITEVYEETLPVIEQRGTLALAPAPKG